MCLFLCKKVPQFYNPTLLFKTSNHHHLHSLSLNKKMSSSMHQIISARQLLLFSLHSFMVCTIIPVCRASVTKNPDQALDPRELGTGIKCGSCPCVNPCSQLVPPPPPPPPQTLYGTPLAPPPPPQTLYVVLDKMLFHGCCFWLALEF
ncbi:LEUCINE-RICH REPEAT EXTENSIN-LIKE PROTEIN 2 [Salix purpurea]|uniref:LEUCINE-RICH REPEAT EXTENSIN-LIKE PROTEIN 2 n=1 Tax=Salix purpurea TaxID=77065 RepID=A0A9Q0WGN6_SALPP|nr:LEUCINE-RICH REPEAT EXTENSIN-LIKE PROTEIN 2 [Salix purpurea]